MLIRLNIAILVIVLVFVACSSDKGKNRIREILTCDSAVVMYYYTPGNPRFFNMTRVKNMDSLSVVANDVNNRPVNASDTCTTQGKIHFYGKGGAVYPVYFSRTGNCMQFSFIKTGVKYFSSMSDASKSVLDDMEKRVTVLSGRKE